MGCVTCPDLDDPGIICNFKNADQTMESSILSSKNFKAFFGDNQVLKGISMDIPRKKVVAMMGPSGCGKTTYLRCINRMHELTAGATSNGKMLLNNEDVYDMHPIYTRLKIGM